MYAEIDQLSLYIGSNTLKRLIFYQNFAEWSSTIRDMHYAQVDVEPL